jgi:hypothetical protein
MNAPVIGAEAGYADVGKWSMGFSWRYQESDRHFRGSEEQVERKAEGSEVINTAHMLELALTKTVTTRWSVTFGIPYFMLERSSPIRDPSLPDNQFGNSPVVQRTITQARGIGDVTVVPRWWAFDPPTHPDYNLALGFGVKLPTGENNAQDTRQVRIDDPNIPNDQEPHELENVIRTVDQSIQPGDGGFGVVFDLQGFLRFGGNRGAAYLTATYLANPENTSGVATYRDDEPQDLDPNTPGTEAYTSVADQYLYRVGGTWFPSLKTGLSLGLRWEGVAVHDLLGDSDGFRRPGYAFSVEPGFSHTSGPHTFSLLVPIAVHRDRKKSVPDLEVPPRNGDAAFADWVLILGYFRRF